MTIKPILTGAKNVGKVLIATAAALCMAEVGCAGAQMLEKDADLVGKAIKHKKDPKVYKVKTKRFGKAETVTVNPVTGKVKPYAGNKKPVNKKAVKMYK